MKNFNKNRNLEIFIRVTNNPLNKLKLANLRDMSMIASHFLQEAYFYYRNLYCCKIATLPILKY